MKVAALILLAAAAASATSFQYPDYYKYFGGGYGLPEMQYFPQQLYKNPFQYFNKEINYYNPFYRMPYFNDFFTVQVPEHMLKAYLPESIFQAYVPTPGSLPTPFVPEHILKNYFPEDLFKFFAPTSSVQYFPVPIQTLRSYLPEQIFRTYVPYMATQFQEDYYVPQSVLRSYLPETMYKTILTVPYTASKSGIVKSSLPIENQQLLSYPSYFRSGSVGFQPHYYGTGYEYGYGFPVVGNTQPIVEAPALF